MKSPKSLSIPNIQTWIFEVSNACNTKLEIAAQGIAQCEVSATHVVEDVALRRIGKSRHGGHKIANISRDCERI